MSPKPLPIPQPRLLASHGWKEYQLLDSGNGQKLEQYGPIRLIRPEPEAIWQPAQPEREWKSAHAIFQPAPEENGGHWVPLKEMPPRWQMSYKSLRFWVQTTSSRHLGVFPEQACQWDWIAGQIQAAKRPINVLNLFGYTGIASLAAAEAGATVTHLDASKKVITWGRENQTLSKLENKPIRWILDDAVKFVQRESRRGTHYDGIILDPPKFGRGPKGEVWEFYKLLPNLLQSCKQILSQQPLFLVLTAYAVKASSVTLYYALQDMLKGTPGVTEAGEVVLQEQSAGRLISMAIYARWSSIVQES